MFIGKFFHLRAQFNLYMYIKHTIYLPSYEGLTKGLFNPCNGLNLTVYNHKVNKSPCLLESSFIQVISYSNYRYS